MRYEGLANGDEVGIVRGFTVIRGLTVLWRSFKFVVGSASDSEDLAGDSVEYDSVSIHGIFCATFRWS